jgi:protein associated with RNAse G/E
VLVDPDFSFEILDLDDFDQNAKRYAYPSEIQRNARQAVMELVDLIESRSFPFDQ